MDIVSIEMGIGMLLLFVVPVVYVITNQARKEKKTIKKIEAICSHKNIKLSTFEIIDSLFVGIGVNSKYLAFGSLPVDESTLEIINLHEVKSCSIFKDELPKPGQPKATIIERVGVAVTVNRNNTLVKKEIIFFDDDRGNDPHIAMNQAKIWNGHIQNTLK